MAKQSTHATYRSTAGGHTATPFVTKAFFLLTSILFTSVSVNGEPGADPTALGMGNARIVHGGGSNAAVLNPAMLGAQIEPWGGAQLFPLVNSYTAGYWSDKLALTPYRAFFSIDKEGQWQKVVTQILNRSFNIAGKSPEKTSKKITDKIDGGASVYSAAGVSLLGATIGKIGVDIRTSVDARVDIPDAPFLLLFSESSSLKPGADLPITHLGARAAVVTDINLGYGQPVDLSGIATRLNDLLNEYSDFKYASWGLGLTVSLGNGYLNLSTNNGGIHYADDGSNIVMDVDATLRTTGTGMQENYTFDNPYKDGFSFAGWGAGINAGMLLYGEHSSVSVALRRLGPMIWNNVLEGKVRLRTQEMTIAGLYDSDVFDPDKGGMLPDEHDSLKNIGTLVSWQPTRLNIGLGYRFNFRHQEKKALHALSEFLNTAVEYEQSLAPWPTRSFVPRLALGIENGFLWGFFPFRTGFIFGGAEKIASTAGFSIGTREFNLQVGYEAIGTPFWYPKRGFEVAFGFSTEWKKYRDPDRDGVSDKKDRCPYEAEDRDGYKDDDGCPDPDNDNDQVADSLDKCPDATEDIDGFEDNDGCPDLDNDKDGIPDSTDKCRLVAEDIDGFEDDDGCPDLDNDKDGIPDSIDACKNEAEDFNGTSDQDGCPETDSDNDAILDSVDACPRAAETFNFFMDDDGCPDTAPAFTPEQNARLAALLSGIRFDKKGKPDKKAPAKLDSLGVLLGTLPSQHYLLCWAGNALADSVRKNRTDTMVALLEQRGIARSRIAVPETGCSTYCNGCGNTPDGSLFIKVVETVGEFQSITKKEPPPSAPAEVAPVKDAAGDQEPGGKE